MTTPTALAPPPAADPAVASFITEAVGDVSRPRAMLRPVADLRHLPGDKGLAVGFRNALLAPRRGADFYVALRQRYGRVFRTQIGAIPLAVIADPEALAGVLRNDDGVWSTALPWTAYFHGLDSESERLDLLLTLDFEPHRDARKLLQPAFSAAATAGYLDMALPVFERAIESWCARGSVGFKAEIRRLLATVSARIFLGIDDEREGEALDRTLAAIWGGTLALAKNTWLSPSWRRAVRAHERLRNTLRGRLRERRARGGGDDLFSRLCMETRGARWLDDDGIVRLFITVLLGAFDTTASGLAGMAYLIARHPEWQGRLRAEATAVAQRRLAYDDVKRMELTDRAWKESLRLFPVSVVIFRMPLREVEVAGVRVPAGAYTLLSSGALGRDTAWWSDPLRFDPERFSPERAEDKQCRGTFLPFGAGAHACIGSHLANIQMKAFWHAMLTRCRFQLKPRYEATHVFDPIGGVSGPVRLAIESLERPVAEGVGIVRHSARSARRSGAD